MFRVLQPIFTQKRTMLLVYPQRIKLESNLISALYGLSLSVKFLVRTLECTETLILHLLCMKK